jgi:hypothetical protein
MHTEGKLNTQGVHIFDEDNHQVCTVIGDFSDYEKTKSTSLRLVACWNEHDDLVKERDELVKALRALYKDILDEFSYYPDPLGIESILAKYPQS